MHIQVYYKKYNASPGKNIQDIFKIRKKELKEEESFLIEEFFMPRKFRE